MALALGLLDAVAAAFERATRSIARRGGDAAWVAAHALGAHRWRDGYEVDLERGWRQYRGSRCVVCNLPWEGW
ncbi:MAG TPA: hypothetical protein VJ506_11375 [Candidatus Limnocylindrales bacterium]|nr:hypothetical protein [Candidatus Limnocylindrales bacterium]